MTEPTGWQIADGVVAFLFSCITTAGLVWLVWRMTERLLRGFLGRNIAFFGALFAAVLIGVKGVKIAADFLSSYKKIPIIQGVVSGIADTINACITPKIFIPFEFIVIIGFLLYVCYWMHTRFVPKQTMDDIKDKFDHTIDPDLPTKPPHDY